MSTKEKEDVVVSNVTPNSHTEAAQLRLQEVRQSREKIPYFVAPVSSKETIRLAAVSALNPEFVELTAVATANHNALVRGDGLTPAEVRDLMAYADAYSPVADEHEAMAQFLRHSITAARNRAGIEALTTYELAKRLAKLPQNAGLATHVADMRRALGKVRGKETPEQLAKRAAKLSAKAAKAKAQAAQKPPVPEPADTTQTS
jgi:hypothetical protein